VRVVDLARPYPYIRHLRRKLEANPEQPAYIRSEPGFGFMLDCPPTTL
jgi:DNA-binding response OmpR family regulator